MKRILRLFLLFNISFISSYSQITFSPHFQIPTGGYFNLCTAEDVNHDSLNDLIIASWSPNKNIVWIYKQENGQLTFGDTLKYSYDHSTSSVPRSIATGDLNNDGLKDLALAFDDTVKIYFQNTTNGFFDTSNVINIKVDSANAIHGLAIGDINDDGLNDIAVSNWNNLTLTIFYQNNNQTFNRIAYFKRKASNNHIIISDINNDGLNDVIVSNGSTFSISTPDANKYSFAVYVQDSISHLLKSPQFYSIDTTSPNSWFANFMGGIAVGDIDNDGWKDIITTHNQQAYIWHHSSTSPSLFNWHPDSLGTYANPKAVYLADLNNDSKKEIIIEDDGYSFVSVYESDTVFNYNYSNSSLVSIWTGSNLDQYMMSVSDLNNDNYQELFYNVVGELV